MTTAVILFALSNTLKVVYPFLADSVLNQIAMPSSIARAIEKMKVSNSIIV